ncbi:MAG TPA: YDG domain-containing protein [Anaerolineales bacterium]|nr:YDG domain-containing protein [Anaerolineales bacterium]
MKSIHHLTASMLVLIAVFLSQLIAPQTAQAECSGIIYVNAASTASSPTGCSWADAFQKLQDALAVVDPGNQIWVAQGTYYPDEGAGLTDNDRTNTFNLPDDVAIYGGFNGTETSLDDRNPDPATNNTILSGDIDGTPGISGNAYHVVRIFGTSSSTILDGFTITGGYSNGTGGFGGGLYIENANPTLRNLLITNNRALTNGGGVFVLTSDNTLPEASYSRPSFENVTISDNIADTEGGGIFAQNASPILNRVVISGNTAEGAGGGISSHTLTPSDAPSVPQLTDVTFSGNTGRGGGGLYLGNSNAILNNVTFDSNIAQRRGGGMFNENSNPTLVNVTFYNNVSNDSFADPRGGGGMMNLDSDPVLNNVTFSGNNSAVIGGDAMRNVQNSNPVINNSIFWGDTDDEITGDGTGSLTLRDSVVQGGCPSGATCTNVINANPNLGTLADNGGFTQTIAIGTGSSALDAGGVNAACAATDQRGVARPEGPACDIGAFELEQPDATTLTVSPVTGIYGDPVTLSATLESDGSPLSGKTINFTLNGSSVGSAVTDSSGIATLNSVLAINVGVYPAGVSASFAGDSSYTASSDSDTLTVNQRPITVTAVTDSKTYDGTTASSGIPTITSGSLASGDTATFSQTFDNKNVGTGKTLTPSASISDGNGGNNYNVTLVNNTNGVITAKNLTVNNITAANKVYDGTTSASLNTSSASLVGVVTGDDVNLDTSGATGTFADKHVGNNKTVTISGLSLSGADAGNYTLTQPTATADITPRPLTVTAVADSKTYDGTTASSASPTVTGSLASGDTATFSQTFDNKNVGTGKTLTPSASISDGNGGNNYNVTLVNNTNGTITPRPITVTAVTDTKFYDGTTSSSGIPIITSGSLASGDSATWSQAFLDPNPGTGKTLRPSGSVSDGNGGNNYVVTFVDDNTGVINPNFSDVPASHWAWQYIERLYASGITGGCATNPLRYCPSNTVTRAQMAIFLLRGIHGASYTPPSASGTIFNDVTTSTPGAAWIEQLYAEGITSGCGGGNYCPSSSVTRAQMAIFLLRAKYGASYTPPPATGTVFSDVTTSTPGAAWIEQLYAEGITSGCGGGKYCPSAAVTRAEMAVFLVRTFNLP